MSLPLLLSSDWWKNHSHPHQIHCLCDQSLGSGVQQQGQLLNPSMSERFMIPQRDRRMRSLHCRPWSEMMRQGEGAMSVIKADKDKFQVILNVQQFKPEEISVKVVDKYVVAEAKHEEKQDEHGWVTRHFVRKYIIPEQCDIDRLSSSLSSDGMLSIIAPRNDQPETQNERSIEIKLTGKPAIQETTPLEKKEQQQTKGT